MSAVGTLDQLRTWLIGFFVGVTLIPLTGCALFHSKLPQLSQLHQVRKLPPIQAPPDAISLDIVFVERPTGDALLGEELWQHVDEASALEPETRALLRQNGFRVGVVSARPPAALQTMLGLKADFVYEPEAEKAKQLVGRQVTIRSGNPTEVQVSPYFSECQLQLHDGQKSRPVEFDDARCMYQLTCERLQDGWVKLDFVPQIRYGDARLRHVANEEGWRFDNVQKQETFYPQRFSLMLSVGEMAVLTADEDAGATLGQRFFRGATDADSGVQRLLVVRLSDMRNSDDPYREK